MKGDGRVPRVMEEVFHVDSREGPDEDQEAEEDRCDISEETTT